MTNGASRIAPQEKKVVCRSARKALLFSWRERLDLHGSPTDRVKSRLSSGGWLRIPPRGKGKAAECSYSLGWVVVNSSPFLCVAPNLFDLEQIQRANLLLAGCDFRGTHHQIIRWKCRLYSLSEEIEAAYICDGTSRFSLNCLKIWPYKR